jgi:hypothetical protein
MYLVMGINKIKFADFVVTFATFPEILFQKLQLIADNKRWATPRNHSPPPSQHTANPDKRIRAYMGPIQRSYH